MSTSLRTALSLALCASLASSSVALAGPPPPPPPPPSGSAAPVADQPPDPNAVSAEERLKWAKKLYKEASAATEASDFFTAVVKFEQAYSFAPDKHKFALNIAQAAWELKDCARVKQYLALFLDKEKDEELLKQGRELLAKADGNKECVTGGPEPAAGTTTKQPVGPAEDNEDPLLEKKDRDGGDNSDSDDGPKKRGASGLLIGGVVLAVLGVGAAGGGIGTMLAAKGKAKGIEDQAGAADSSTQFAQGQYDSGVSGDMKSLKTLNLVTPILLAAGGAMLVGGIVMIVIDRGNKKKSKGFYARRSGVELAGIGAAPLPGGGAAGSFALHF